MAKAARTRAFIGDFPHLRAGMSGFRGGKMSTSSGSDNPLSPQLIYASGGEVADSDVRRPSRPAACGYPKHCVLALSDKIGDTPRMTSSSSTRADRLRTLLTQAFAPSILQIQDDSARHAGHAGAQAGGQSHFSVVMVSAAFQGVSRVARSRAVHDALAAEFGPPEQGGMHALALTLRTPEEHAMQAGR